MIRQPRIPKQNFFKGMSPKGFSYSPLRYDEEKERVEDLKRRVKSAQGGNFDSDFMRERIREGLRRRRNTRSDNWKYVIRLGIILAVLIALINFVLAV